MNKDQFEIEWWDDYYNADYFERQKMVRKLPIFKEVFSGVVFNKDKKVNEILLEGKYNLINSYFEDLIDYMRTRQRLEKNG